MILTERKPADEIVAGVGDKVFMVGCCGCPEGCDTGGPARLNELAGELESAGKTVLGRIEIDFLCNKALVGIRLGRHAKGFADADTLLVVSCGIGVQAVGNMTDGSVFPALNTISVGGSQGLFPSNERCRECGDCLLGITGGLCPVTLCAKGLVNGQCGGANEGLCEVGDGRPCGWELIYKRCEELGTLDQLKRFIEPRDHSKQDIPEKLRTTVRWALEYEETAEEAEPSKE